MSWQARAGKKLMSADEAVAAVESGHCVAVAPFTSTPATLCEALYRRRRELRNVRIDHPAGLHSWVREGDGGSFEVHEIYATAVNRDMVNGGRLEYLPLAVWRVGQVPSGFHPAPDAFLVAVSPPDARGFCSFGSGVWFSKLISENAKTVIAEVHEDFMRTGGDNFVHLSRLDRLCLAQPAPPPPIPPRNEEEAVNTEVICKLVAAKLVHDRDTLQIGVGTVSAAVGRYLGDKHDLGIQTELVTDGIATFLRDGVITGKYKTLHTGKVVASACALLSNEESAILDGHPAFELYDFGYTDDVRFLVRQKQPGGDQQWTLGRSHRPDRLRDHWPADLERWRGPVGVHDRRAVLAGRALDLRSAFQPHDRRQAGVACRRRAPRGHRGHCAADARRLRRHRAGDRVAARQDHPRADR